MFSNRHLQYVFNFICNMWCIKKRDRKKIINSVKVIARGIDKRLLFWILGTSKKLIIKNLTSGLDLNIFKNKTDDTIIRTNFVREIKNGTSVFLAAKKALMMIVVMLCVTMTGTNIPKAADVNFKFSSPNDPVDPIMTFII